MVTPTDESARARFASELDRNFSVVASAGSGKTQAITERIVQLAQSKNALEILPKLVVVTFTHRAADEMQQRTRQQILEARPRLPLERIEADSDRDRWFTAPEALDYGFVDHIITSAHINGVSPS